MDFEKQYLFYEKYHNDPTNKLVHIITIPIIVLSLFIFGSFVKLGIFINLSFMLWIIYSIIWIFLNPLAGFTGSMFYLLLLVISNLLSGIPGIVVLFIHICCWVAQIYSHKHFEGNSPALMDSLIQAFLMAPLFVVCEMLFMVNCLTEVKEDISNARELMVHLNEQETSKFNLNVTNSEINL